MHCTDCYIKPLMNTTILINSANANKYVINRDFYFASAHQLAQNSGTAEWKHVTWSQHGTRVFHMSALPIDQCYFSRPLLYLIIS